MDEKLFNEHFFEYPTRYNYFVTIESFPISLTVFQSQPLPANTLITVTGLAEYALSAVSIAGIDFVTPPQLIAGSPVYVSPTSFTFQIIASQAGTFAVTIPEGEVLTTNGSPNISASLQLEFA